MFDKWFDKRTSDGVINMELLTSIDMPLVHIVHDFFPWSQEEEGALLIVDYWQLNNQYALAMTAQHDKKTLLTTQGVYLLQDNVPTWKLQSYLKTYDMGSTYALPWMMRPVQMGHSPLRWWFANRPAEALVFCERMGRVFSDLQWMRTGLSFVDTTSPYNNILSLIRMEHQERRMRTAEAQLHFA